MIYKDGKKWEGWKDLLKKQLGAPNIEATCRKARFEVTDRYSGLKEIGRNNKPVTFQMSRAISVGVPVEFNWIDPEGNLSVIRYVTHVEKRIEQGREFTVEHPGSLFVQDGKFDVRKNPQELFWFWMTSPFCENGFAYDEQWGTSKEAVKRNNEQRTLLGLHPKYRYVDEAEARRKRMDKANRKFEAEKFVRDLLGKERLELYMSFGHGVNDDDEAVLEFLVEKAKSDPDKILNADKNETSYKALVNQAELAGVIEYKKKSRSWHFAGKQEHIVFVTAGNNPTSFFADWLKTKDDGEQVFTAIKEGLKKKEQEEPEEVI